MRYAYRPFDTRWLYWEPETKLLNEKRPDYRPHIFPGNLWLSAAPHLRKNADEPQACVTRHLACLHLMRHIAYGQRSSTMEAELVVGQADFVVTGLRRKESSLRKPAPRRVRTPGCWR